MEPQLCTELLPTEMWEVILDQLDSLDDLFNCQSTCKTWESIVNRKIESLLLFSKVLPILWNRLSPRDILSCRLVCHGWRDGVDDCPFFRPPQDWHLYYDRKYDSHRHSPTPPQLRSVCENRSNPPPLKEIRDYFSLDLECPSSQFSRLRFSPALARSLTCRLQIRAFPPKWNESKSSSSAEEYQMGFMYPMGDDDTTNYHLICNSTSTTNDDRKTLVTYLTLPFTTFPKLKVLRLDFPTDLERWLTTEEKSRVEELESEVLEVVKALRRENKVRLHNLIELQVGIDKKDDDKRKNGIFPFSRWISALVRSAPRLQKVSLQFGGLGFLEQEEIEVLNRIFCAVATTTTTHPLPVTQLDLRNWPDSLNVNGFGHSSGHHHDHWPLKCLVINLVGSRGKRVSAPSLLRTFFDILERFGGSLEELQLTIRSAYCIDLRATTTRGNGNSTPGGVPKLGRKCFCNTYYDEFEHPEQVPEVQRRSGAHGGVARFEKLKLLSIPHSLLHPVIFFELMETTPALATLRINDLGWKDWAGKHSRVESVQLLQGLVGGLWEEAPPTLNLILVDKWRTDWNDYEFPRRMFEKLEAESALAPHEGPSSSISSEPQARVRELWERAIVGVQKERAKECVVS